MLDVGNITQWGEVKKKTKDRSQSKVKDSATPLSETSNNSARPGRGRGGLDGSRGARGRGSERGRGAGRGGRGGPSTNGRITHVDKGPPEPTPTGEWGTLDQKVEVEGGWDQPIETESAAMESSWENITAPDIAPQPAAELPKPSSKPDGTRSWASILIKPAPAPAPIPPKAHQAPSTHEASVEESIAVPTAPVEPDMAALPPPSVAETDSTEIPQTPPASDLTASEPPADITPSKDELTETNLEQVLDISGPPASATAASTVASTIDNRIAGDGTTPGPPLQQNSIARPPLGGYATSAYKATGLPARTASYQRKILEQQEAVVMPGKHAVDRTAVQFGSLGLSGPTEDMDVDSDREEAETRAQPPQHSPIARAALPPAPQQQAFPTQPPPVSEPLPTPRQAPGLPPVSQQPSQPPSTEQAPQQLNPSNYPYNQFNNRYTSAGQQEVSAPTQKGYEPFGQQIQQQPQHQYDGYPSTSQAPAQSQPQTQAHLGSYSSASQDSSAYYTSDNQRNAYQNYYASYGQSQQSLQEAGGAQPRIGSAFGTTVGEQPSHHATSQGQQPTQTRYGQPGDAQTSGTSTPNPTASGQQQQSQPPHTQQMLHQQQQAQGQAGGQHAGYPYGHPYFASPYYSAYVNQVSAHPYGRERPMFDDVRRYDDQYLTHNPQFGYGGSHGGYGGGPFAGAAAAKQGMYGQPHQGYGMSPQQTSYDQNSSSPANVGGFAQQQSVPSRDGTGGGTLANYGRSGSAQPSENQQQYSSTSGYGSMPDAFTRSASGFPAQAQALTHLQGGGPSSTNDDSRGSYGDSAKVPGGPSPALGQPSGRPGSAANSMQGQNSLPPPQTQSQQNQQGYGGYPGLVNHQMQQHGQHASQYGAGPPGGGVGGHHGSATQQTHQGNGGYGSAAYGAGGFGGSYYGGGGNNRGGWGGNYGGH